MPPMRPGNVVPMPICRFRAPGLGLMGQGFRIFGAGCRVGAMVWGLELDAHPSKQ